MGNTNAGFRTFILICGTSIGRAGTKFWWKITGVSIPIHAHQRFRNSRRYFQHHEATAKLSCWPRDGRPAARRAWLRRRMAPRTQRTNEVNNAFAATFHKELSMTRIIIETIGQDKAREWE
jgi:hypothetical protein